MVMHGVGGILQTRCFQTCRIEHELIGILIAAPRLQDGKIAKFRTEEHGPSFDDVLAVIPAIDADILVRQGCDNCVS